MQTHFTNVCEFMAMCNQDVITVPTVPDERTQNLRYELIAEEVSELKEAIENLDIIEVADALTDILYVGYGAYAAYGLTPTYPDGFVKDWDKLHDTQLHGVGLQDIDLYTSILICLKSGKLDEVKKALDIIIRHTYNLAYTCGINIFACFTEVHSSNMSKACITKKDAQLSIKQKVDANNEKSKDYIDAVIVKVNNLFVIKRAQDMKVLKGKDYFDPDLVKIINKL